MGNRYGHFPISHASGNRAWYAQADLKDHIPKNVALDDTMTLVVPKISTPTERYTRYGLDFD